MQLAIKILVLAAIGMTVVTGYQIHHLTVTSENQQKEIDKLEIAVNQSAAETAELLKDSDYDFAVSSKCWGKRVPTDKGTMCKNSSGDWIIVSK